MKGYASKRYITSSGSTSIMDAHASAILMPGLMTLMMVTMLNAAVKEVQPATQSMVRMSTAVTIQRRTTCAVSYLALWAATRLILCSTGWSISSLKIKPWQSVPVRRFG